MTLAPITTWGDPVVREGNLFYLPTKKVLRMHGERSNGSWRRVIRVKSGSQSTDFDSIQAAYEFMAIAYQGKNTVPSSVNFHNIITTKKFAWFAHAEVGITTAEVVMIEEGWTQPCPYAEGWIPCK